MELYKKSKSLFSSFDISYEIFVGWDGVVGRVQRQAKLQIILFKAVKEWANSFYGIILP